MNDVSLHMLSLYSFQPPPKSTTPANHRHMMSPMTLLLYLLLLLLHHLPPCPAAPGHWSLLHQTIGISAMHMQLLPNDRVVIFDRTDFGPSNISLPDKKCRSDPNDMALKLDCTAHSVEYDVSSNTIRPLMVLTDVWCSSGALTPDGSLVQTGGFNDGDHVVRVYKSCDECDWREIDSGLIERRWYATSHILPDGRQIIIGGRRQYNFEFYPKRSPAEKAQSLPFLVETYDQQIENNLYPFVFLHTNGNLFIFANNRAILYDYSENVVVKTYPEVPGGDPRNYPSTGSAVLLPMRIVQGVVAVVEVLVCGGAPKGAHINAKNGKFDGALDSCGRIKISDPDPKWAMETMPMGRVMGDMLLLPNSNVLIINGGSSGTAGWEYGRNPVLKSVIYKPDDPIGSRFEVQNPSTIPRMYHSAVVLVRDGRVLVGGSNPHERYNFTNVLYPTELSLEAFSPSYLDVSASVFRPKILSLATRIQYGKRVDIRFKVQSQVDTNLIYVTMVAPSFNTHSFSMNQRLLVLDGGNLTTKIVGDTNYEVGVRAPPSCNVAPEGYYLLFVVHRDIPSEGVWVHVE
ncbi:putative galactose oxidase [Helianthus annuus]|nr:putative galactose oxidase [Helianthus annuus]